MTFNDPAERCRRLLDAEPLLIEDTEIMPVYFRGQGCSVDPYIKELYSPYLTGLSGALMGLHSGKDRWSWTCRDSAGKRGICRMCRISSRLSRSTLTHAVTVCRFLERGLRAVDNFILTRFVYIIVAFWVVRHGNVLLRMPFCQGRLCGETKAETAGRKMRDGNERTLRIKRALWQYRYFSFISVISTGSYLGLSFEYEGRSMNRNRR